jgi:translation initiation factor 2B subunit (eIF-2B alpha/beta/delta family)
MHRSQRLEALVTPLRDDVRSGAAQLAYRAANVLREVAGWDGVTGPGDLRALVAEAGIRIIEAQPAMAPLVALAAHVLNAMDGVEGLEEARGSARLAARAFATSLDARAETLARRASALLPAEGDILTLSSSSTVRRVLLLDPLVRRGRVVVLESRPAREGKATARALAEAGIPVLFAVDAAAATLVEGCRVVLLGADSIGDRGVVNKVGSLAAVLGALRADVPVLVAADTTKILPPGFPQRLSDDRPGHEVWSAPDGVTVWNRYFEALPLAAVDVVVTEMDAFRTAEVESWRRALGVPAELAAWARRRMGDPQRE